MEMSHGEWTRWDDGSVALEQRLRCGSVGKYVNCTLARCVP